MNITSKMAMAIGMNFLFGMHRHEISEEIRLYLELAQDLKFLDNWEVENNQLILTFYEGTQKNLDVRASSTFEYLKEQVEFFYRAMKGDLRGISWAIAVFFPLCDRIFLLDGYAKPKVM